MKLSKVNGTLVHVTVIYTVKCFATMTVYNALLKKNISDREKKRLPQTKNNILLKLIHVFLN